jgi:hypothetical protein
MTQNHTDSTARNLEIHMLRSGPFLMKIKTPVSVRHAGLVRLAHRVNPPLVAALRHPWVESIVRLSAVEDALTAVHPLLSLTQVRARVVRIIDETASTKTFVLQPNALMARCAGRPVCPGSNRDSRAPGRARLQPVVTPGVAPHRHHGETPGAGAGVPPSARCREVWAMC